MTYTIGWSQGQAEVAAPEDVDPVLDHIAADPDGPYLVHVAPHGRRRQPPGTGLGPPPTSNGAA
jgi:hypothetical protein